MKNILITGGAGFIGSHVVRRFVQNYQDYHIFNLDALTYAGNLENIKDIEKADNYTFLKGDIVDEAFINAIFAEYRFDGVLHLAAESHVDRSIAGAAEFIKTDVIGTYVLLEAARRATGLRRFVQVSTDEVYGHVPTGHSLETDELKPRNPYSASKAAADRLAYSFWATYDVHVVITRASKNCGQYKFPEKVIPLFATNAL